MIHNKIDGQHIQLTNVDRDLNEQVIYPVNTVNDIIMDNNGNKLADYLPTVDDSLDAPTTSSPMVAVENGTEEVDETVLDALIKG